MRHSRSPTVNRFAGALGHHALGRCLIPDSSSFTISAIRTGR
jgi:hypothetical protein